MPMQCQAWDFLLELWDSVPALHPVFVYFGGGNDKMSLEVFLFYFSLNWVVSFCAPCNTCLLGIL